MRTTVVLLLLACATGCGGAAGGPDAASEWRGTITTEGDVTAVVNESGSVWGGPSVLVEEASIGVLEGDAESMLGSVRSIAYDGERILVVDSQVPIVRIYDREGGFLGEMGGAGQGPGEYEEPASVAIAGDGRIFVRDDRGSRILVYSAAGEHLETFPLRAGFFTFAQMVVGPGEVPYTWLIVERLENDPARPWITGMQAHGPEGPYGEPIIPPSYEREDGVLVASRNGRPIAMVPVPFWPSERWTLTPQLDMVSGVATEYRFEITRQAGGKLVVTRGGWAPVPVQPEEAAWHRRSAIATLRGRDPAWTWNGPEIPATKPPYSQLIVADSREIWVVRPGPGEPIEPCNEDAEEPRDFSAAPCWRESWTLEVFGADGRYLGAVEVPPGMSFGPPPQIRGDEVVARVEDNLGTVYVKRYRRTLRAPME